MQRYYFLLEIQLLSATFIEKSDEKDCFSDIKSYLCTLKAKISSIMKQLNKKYNDEDNMLVNDLRSIVSKARSKAFAAVNYSLVERNWE